MKLRGPKVEILPLTLSPASPNNKKLNIGVMEQARSAWLRGDMNEAFKLFQLAGNNFSANKRNLRRLAKRGVING